METLVRCAVVMVNSMFCEVTCMHDGKKKGSAVSFVSTLEQSQASSDNCFVAFRSACQSTEQPALSAVDCFSQRC